VVRAVEFQQSGVASAEGFPGARALDCVFRFRRLARSDAFNLSARSFARFVLVETGS
jgi:hypothetical protein